MDVVTLMAVVAIALVIGWLALHLPEPPRMIVIAVLLIALVFVLFRLLGLL